MCLSCKRGTHSTSGIWERISSGAVGHRVGVVAVRVLCEEPKICEAHLIVIYTEVHHYGRAGPDEGSKTKKFSRGVSALVLAWEGSVLVGLAELPHIRLNS
jgi:hypothetical protein